MLPSVIKGGESFFYPGGDPGCLVVHGFTASPQEVHRLGNHLSECGFTVLGVRLFGHGTTLNDMARSRKGDWIASVEDGYHILQSMCTSIIPIGLSLGGALAILTASKLPVASFVAISTPNRIPESPLFDRLRPILRPLSFFYRFKRKGPSNWYDPLGEIGRVAYDAQPLRSVLELELLLEEMRAALPQLNVPGLFIHSRTDDFVPHDHMISNFDLLGSKEKEKVSIALSNHILTCDISREEVFSTVEGFVNRISGFKE